jgi:hypothetical protein
MLPSVKPMPARLAGGVEHGDDDGHVGAADRHDDQRTEGRRTA